MYTQMPARVHYLLHCSSESHNETVMLALPTLV
jgi:hypothetical protein